MVGMTGNPYAANRHADVLNEEPSDEPAKMRLVEEVKNRAKGAFQQKDMPSAELLYGKAITVLDTMPDKAEATLFSNRAMVRLNLNKVEEALSDCKRCLEIDPKSVKAWFRKAQALQRLGEWEEAIQAAEAGIAVEPDNKSFPDLIDKVRKEMEKDAEDKAKLKREAQDVRVELHNASTARAPPVKKERKDENGEEANGMRGYKKTADGRTTSYFHTEISDEAKKLIEAQGFGKPQKLEGAPVVDEAAKGGGSTWNQAGTYEEKGMLKWAEERLRSGLTGLTFEIPSGAGGGTARTTGASDIKGDASISVSRGKRRYLLDLTANVDFEVTVGEATGKGRMVLSEVTAADDDEPEVKVEMSADTASALREVINTFVKSSSEGLQPLVRQELQAVIAEYKTK